ncbi:hypothetical protein AN5453.2 [Aspergillus nidulans FGSC A4]|uniref:Arrestin (Or S-antigen), N-terminal domain protein (AFU_orthologue AFUA_6G13380) n=1 Tax=Emericella nidulans (strain FGSC A4 / ATCC 38163 / CBS 112.46 / NRRL 194 / M139) TaxID=227321 RepID=Q5B1X7_EMENI|nr:protein artG [Aspergillus nidulans FGSC A4]EAA62613.1 hypothetical protein AN5453.2 [Aspergillus nidulans FGSC A4]CBF81883.1 TPA: arrestin (or S-antigen), N-terminal domain protein (AFU_orthologue; AFUA_6G13380) [Aspergillus nidulans FGSC A4]|eukprot:XP_663057.1 hypothetical protein AN5453.2 [Aspergillus nidulans FGSC A4]
MSASLLSAGTRAADVLYPFASPQIKIELASETGSAARAYTTGDRIEGTVTVTANHLISFDEVNIQLEGSQAVLVERGMVPGRTGATQTFLRLRQPIEDSLYPMPRVLEPGRSYQFQFTFVIPQRLLPHICSHHKANAHIHDSHTLLLPSLGDPVLSRDGRTALDDMSPDMTRVTYHIRAEVLQRPVVGPAKTLKLARQKIRIVPAVEEEPPLTVLDCDPVYCTRKEKDVRRGTLRPRQGRLVVAASQPKPLQMNSFPNKSSEPTSTAATIHLRFDPVGDEEPPSLGTVWSKLRVATYYSVRPWDNYPTASVVSASDMSGQGVYQEILPLSSRCVASAQWTKHGMDSLARRYSLQSASSAESITGPSASWSGDNYYTASVVVPVSLPTNRAFVPTFHSCLISRIYILEFCISYHTPNMNIITPTVTLKVPIQLTSGQPGSVLAQSSEEITQEEVDAEFFSPRTIAPPVMGSASAPPDYAEYTSSLPSARPREVRCS